MLVANHSSYLDSVVLAAAIPRDCRFVANHMAATRPLLGLIIRKSGHLLVDRESRRSRAACARAMIELLQDGTSLVLFPEGTRAGRDVLPFRAGAFRAAFRTGRPVIPIAISGHATYGRRESVSFAGARSWSASCPPFTRPPILRAAPRACGKPPRVLSQTRCDSFRFVRCVLTECARQYRQHPVIGRPVLDRDADRASAERRTHARDIANKQALRPKTGDKLRRVGSPVRQMAEEEVRASRHHIPSLRFETLLQFGTQDRRLLPAGAVVVKARESFARGNLAWQADGPGRTPRPRLGDQRRRAAQVRGSHA